MRTRERGHGLQKALPDPDLVLKPNMSPTRPQVRAREPAGLRAAIEVMTDRGLDCDDADLDAAKMLLAEIE